MSMIGMLLRLEMPVLPSGKVHTNVCMSSAVTRFKESQKNVQETNVEAVFKAIADGHHDNIAMQAATGLSKTTCFNACCTLLKAGRVTVKTSPRPHRYYTVES